MQRIFHLIKEQIMTGQAVVLVTIVASSGSVPRGTGAHMVVGSAGRIFGTIGGGAVEKRSEEAAMQILQSGNSKEICFDLSNQDVQQLGMICGGNVNVFFRYIPAYDHYTASVADRILEADGRDEALWLVADLKAGGRLTLINGRHEIFGDRLSADMDDLLTFRPKRISNEKYDYYTEQILFPGRVLIFGCGHIGQELEPLLTHLGFKCIVMDDRKEFADPDVFPTAYAVRQIDFHRISDFVTVRPCDYVCVLTRGHAYDTLVQAQVLRCRPRYVGVIGSRSKAVHVRKVLQEEYGITEEELTLITNPIGVSIGASTPAEIAVSIAAQLIEKRSQGQRL